MVTVLLYDLSVNYHRWEITCDGNCKVSVDGVVGQSDSVLLESNEDFLYITSGEDYSTPEKVEVSSLS